HGFVTTDGTVALTGGLKIEIDGTGLSFIVNQPYSYQIGLLNGWANGTQTLTNPAGFATIGFAADPATMSAQISSTGQVFVNFTPTPEPAGLLALAGGAALAAGWLRRRRGCSGRERPGGVG